MLQGEKNEIEKKMRLRFRVFLKFLISFFRSLVISPNLIHIESRRIVITKVNR